MIIIEDTNQKKGQHELKHECFKGDGVELIRCKLPFGDYAPPPRVSVDTKANMGEIAANIGSDHVRFKNECLKAKNAGCHLYFLIENEEGIENIDQVHTWYNPALIFRPRAITGARLEKAMKTMSIRYGCTFLFCKPCEAAGIIERLLEAEK